MRFNAKVLLILVLLGSAFYVGCARPAAASTEGACPVWKAERDVREARRALARSEARLAEAKRVLAATRAYSSSYGSSVGRWVRLSRRVGWPWSATSTLMYVVDRESNGDPDIYNTAGSGAAGLLQLMAIHYGGRFDPTVPRANLSYGLKLWRGSGWSPWAL